jgi:multidrug efflux pump subunit AcrA (membrane-fusion protein)
MAEVTVTDLEQLKAEVSKAEVAYKEAKKQLAQQKAADTNISKEQFDASTQAILNALNSLNEQLEVASTKGSLKAKQIVEGFGGESKFNEFVVNLAGVIGSTVATGGTVGAMPMIIMAGAARGVYKKVIED